MPCPMLLIARNFLELSECSSNTEINLTLDYSIHTYQCFIMFSFKANSGVVGVRLLA